MVERRNGGIWTDMGHLSPEAGPARGCLFWAAVNVFMEASGRGRRAGSGFPLLWATGVYLTADSPRVALNVSC